MRPPNLKLYFLLPTILIVIILITLKTWLVFSAPHELSPDTIPAQFDDKALFLSPIVQNIATTSTSNIHGLIVPHHLLARDLIAQGYSHTREQNYEVIVLLSPDHFTLGETNITTTRKNFATVFGTIASDQKIIDKLENAKYISEENFFYREHGLGAELPFIKYFYPQAKIVTLTLKNTTPQNELDDLLKILESSLPQNSLIIQSTDFSHYLTPAEAELCDQTTWQYIQNNETQNIFSLKQPDNIDSLPALYINMCLQNDFFKTKANLLNHKNSQDYTNEPVNSSTSYFVIEFSK